MATTGFDRGGVYFTDDFGSITNQEESNEGKEKTRLATRNRCVDFIKNFHEGNFAFVYRYLAAAFSIFLRFLLSLMLTYDLSEIPKNA